MLLWFLLLAVSVLAKGDAGTLCPYDYAGKFFMVTPQLAKASKSVLMMGLLGRHGRHGGGLLVRGIWPAIGESDAGRLAGRVLPDHPLLLHHERCRLCALGESAKAGGLQRLCPQRRADLCHTVAVQWLPAGSMRSAIESGGDTFDDSDCGVIRHGVPEYDCLYDGNDHYLDYPIHPLGGRRNYEHRNYSDNH